VFLVIFFLVVCVACKLIFQHSVICRCGVINLTQGYGLLFKIDITFHVGNMLVQNLGFVLPFIRTKHLHFHSLGLKFGLNLPSPV
jgi:hypothetical protein